MTTLSWREKEAFYHDLAQYFHAGIPVREALAAVQDAVGGHRLRNFISGLLEMVDKGDTFHDAFARHPGVFTEMELTLIEAAETSGSLDSCLRHLAEHFATLGLTRRKIIGGLLYPAFLLHFSILLSGIPAAVQEGGGGLPGYLQHVGQGLGLTYGITGIFLLGGWLLLSAAATNPAVDRMTRLIPLFGPLRRASSLARFCLALEIQTRAGLPFTLSLPLAARSSRSGLLLAAAAQAVPLIEAGSSLSQALNDPIALTPPVLRAIRTGEMTGTLETEMRRWGNFHREETLTRLQTLTDWIPRFFYLLIAIYVGWRVIAAFQAYLKQVNDIINNADL